MVKTAAWITLFGITHCAAWDVSNHVIVSHGKLIIDHAKNVHEITQAQAQGGFAADTGLGLFQNKVRTELVFDQTNPRHLVMTTRITTAPVIFIASEFPEGSCAYEIVLSHELTHQRFDLEVLRAMPGEIRSITRTLFSSDAMDLAGTIDLDRARKIFYQENKYVYDGLSFPRHQSIDNPASYRRLSTLCKGEIPRRLAAIKP